MSLQLYRFVSKRMEKADMKLKLLSFAGGVAAGYMVNELWEDFGLFGYGVCRIPLDGHCIGDDDLVILGIGVAIAVYGYMRFRMAMWFGLGWIVGQLVNKAVEIMTAGPVTKTSTAGTETRGF